MKLRDYTENRKFTDCTRLELFNALLRYVADAAKARGYNEGRKKVYYISAEFLIGKLLSNNLINLGLYGEVRDELAAEVPLTDNGILTSPSVSPFIDWNWFCSSRLNVIRAALN